MMTNSSTTLSPSHASAVRGFTLIELLVVIAIIAILVGLLIVVGSGASAAALKTKVLADLQTIAVALEAYRSDFGDYPRVAPANKFPITPAIADMGNSQYISGAELLCWALMGPYNATGTGGFNPGDGLDGFGFRTNTTGRGEKYNSYLNPERFKVGGDPRIPRYQVIFDGISQPDFPNGMPILYFPANPRRPSITSAPVLADRYTDPAPGTPAITYLNLQPYYDLRDNDIAFSRSQTLADNADRLKRFRAILGDSNMDNRIDNGETVAGVGPFLLISAGNDGFFGPTNLNASEIRDCDDILLTPK